MDLYVELDDQTGINKVSGNIVLNYIEAKNADKAFYYLKIQERNTEESSKNQFYLFNNYGSYYALKKEFSKSEEYYQKAIEKAWEFEMVDAYVSAYMNLGACYEQQKKYSKSIQTLNLALKLAEEHNSLPEQKECLEQLYLLHQSLKDYYNCFIIGEKLRPVIDSLYSVEKINFIQELDVQVKLSEKQLLIKQQKNELLRRELKEKKLNQKVLIYSLFILVFIGVSVFIFLNYYKIRKKNQIISRQKEKLQVSHELNQRIFAVVSHDFKGPLNSLEILVDLLDKNKEDPAMSLNLLSDVKNQILQSNLVLENLISYAKSELDLLVNPTQTVSVFELFEEMTALNKTEIESKRLKVENQIDPELKMAVSKDLLKIVGRNLYSNAIKYSYDGGVIRIMNKGTTNIAIEDFGVGISPELKEQLFKDSVKSATGTNFETGFGLGLKISAELAKKMNGQLSFKDKKDGGTIFSLKFKR